MAINIAFERNHPECVHQMLRYIDISMPQIEKMYREATRWRQYDMQEVLRKYMNVQQGGDISNFDPNMTNRTFGCRQPEWSPNCV